jgi:hypothetical protein
MQPFFKMAGESVAPYEKQAVASRRRLFAEAAQDKLWVYEWSAHICRSRAWATCAAMARRLRGCQSNTARCVRLAQTDPTLVR